MLIQEDLAAARAALSLRELIGAGEPLNPEIIEQVRKRLGPDPARRLRPDRDHRADRQLAGPAGEARLDGPAAAGLPVVLLDADGQPADEGEICLALARARPLGLMVGYQDSAETDRRRDARRLLPHRRRREARRRRLLTFVGRADDVFKASDYRISPFELESALIEHEAVAEVAVVPSPDPLRLAVPKAFIDRCAAGATPRPALADARSSRSARAQLAPYKRVRRIEFVAELPKTISGKIRRVELRQQEAERRVAGTRTDGEFFEDDFPGLRGTDGS